METYTSNGELRCYVGMGYEEGIAKPFINLSTSAIVDTWELCLNFNSVMNNWCVHLHGLHASMTEKKQYS